MYTIVHLYLPTLVFLFTFNENTYLKISTVHVFRIDIFERNYFLLFFLLFLISRVFIFCWGWFRMEYLFLCILIFGNTKLFQILCCIIK